MRLASMNWMRPEPIEKTIARLAEAGFDALQISGEPGRYDAAKVRKLLEKHGLACWGAVALMVGGRDPISDKAEVRDATTKYCHEVLDFIQALGGEIMCIVPAEIGRRTPRGAPEQEWQWGVDVLKRVQEKAGPMKIRCGIEPINRFETNFITRHDQALALADAVGGGMGVVLDTFHMNIEERDSYQAILNVGARLVDFQFGDNNRWPAGQGSLDWPKLLGTLKLAGYEGCLTNEFLIPADRTPLNPHQEIDPKSVDPAYAEDLRVLRELGSAIPPDEVYTKALKETVAFMRKIVG